MIPVMALMLMLGLAQSLVAIGCMVLMFCFYISFDRTLALVVRDE